MNLLHTPMKITEERLPLILENEGKKIFAVLHIPKVNTKIPGVIFCHGLAGHKTGKHRVYVDLASSLVSAGIAVLRFDYRGCGDSEGEFFDVTPETHYSDAKCCLQY